MLLHRYYSLMTLRSASYDLSGGRSPAQNRQLDTLQASKKIPNSIHNLFQYVCDLDTENQRTAVKSAVRAFNAG